MRELGFHEERRYYTHPDTSLLIEFPAGPLSIGEEPIMKVEELRFETGVLRLLSPTDCVKDRLAGYYHWQDLQSLEQAVLVAHSRAVDWVEIERWSKLEGFEDEFQLIRHQFPTKESGGFPLEDHRL